METISSTAVRATTSLCSVPETTRFMWNPGDGSDIVEGGAGTDTLVFNGANIDETIDISANGSAPAVSRAMSGT